MSSSPPSPSAALDFVSGQNGLSNCLLSSGVPSRFLILLQAGCVDRLLVFGAVIEGICHHRLCDVPNTLSSSPLAVCANLVFFPLFLPAKPSKGLLLLRTLSPAIPNHLGAAIWPSHDSEGLLCVLFTPYFYADPPPLLTAYPP